MLKYRSKYWVYIVMSILVTGGAGYIAILWTPTMKWLLLRTYLISQKKIALDRVSEIIGRTITFYQCGILDVQLLDIILP